MPTWSLTQCAQCGAEMEQAATGRPRRYCCGACRTAAHRVTKVNRTAQDGAGLIIYQAGGVTAQGAGAGLARKDGE